jgi:hypothetical protein
VLPCSSKQDLIGHLFVSFVDSRRGLLLSCVLQVAEPVELRR